MKANVALEACEGLRGKKKHRACDKFGQQCKQFQTSRPAAVGNGCLTQT